MKTKIYLLVVFALLAETQLVKATNWFVKANVTESGEGTSWDSPVSGADFSSALAAGFFEEGDVVYMTGGTYLPGVAGDSFQVINGITIKGGYPSNLHGTETPELTYPTKNPTIFSGDLNGDGIANSGDIQNIMYISSPSPVTIQGIQFTCAYYEGTDDYEAGAVLVYNTETVIKNCTFEKNTSTYNGGSALANQGSKVHVIDCIFTNNSAMSKGGATRLSSATINDVKIYPVSVFERCLFEGNSNSLTSTGKYGGAIQITSGTCWLINSTVMNNKAFSNGAGISVGDGYSLYVISSTLANNTCSRIGLDASKPYSYGSSIRMEKTANIHIANSICVEVSDEGTKTNPTFYTEGLTQNASELIISGGNNALGTFLVANASYDDQFSAIWKGTDMNGQQFADVFGSNTLTGQGGFSNTIATNPTLEGATVSDLSALLTAWNCPVTADVTVDQRGYSRSSITEVGAYDSKGSPITSITKIPDTDSSALISLGNGRYSIKNNTSDVRIFNISGSMISTSDQNAVIDLSPLAQGIYFIVTSTASYKVIR